MCIRVSVRSIQNCSQDALRTPRDTQERSRQVSGTSGKRLGSVSGSPWCAPRARRESPRAPPDVRGSAQERSGGRRRGQNRPHFVSGSERIEYFLEVPRLLAKTEVRLFALRVESLARCNFGKRRTSTPRSSQSRRKGRHGANRTIFSVDVCVPGGAGERPRRPRGPRRARRARQLACTFRLARLNPLAQAANTGALAQLRV